MTQKRITNLSAEDLEAFFLLLPRIYDDYRDSRRGPYKLAYIYANTVDNEGSSFLRALELANAGGTEALGTSEGDLGNGYDGFGHAVARLKALGLKDGIPVQKFDVGGNVNTGSEAKLLAKYALSNAGSGYGGGDIAVIAPALHIVRAFMTTITALGGAPIRVYAISGTALAWNEKVRHSQGTVADTRSGLLIGELQRLEKYRAPEFGGMLSPREVINYLNWRDS